jgi:hypothetical protein
MGQTAGFAAGAWIADSLLAFYWSVFYVVTVALLQLNRSRHRFHLNFWSTLFISVLLSE